MENQNLYTEQNNLIQNFINENSNMGLKRALLYHCFQEANKDTNLTIVDWNTALKFDNKFVPTDADAIIIGNFIKDNLDTAINMYKEEENKFKKNLRED